MRHPHRLTGVCGGERGVERDAPNVAAGDRETRETIDVERIGRRFRWENPAPDLRPLRLIRKRKLHHEPQPAQERWIERLLHVRGQDGQAAIRFHPLEQIADLDVCVAVVAVFHFAALPEKRIGFVEEQDRAAFLRCIEHAPKILFRLSDVFAHNRAEIDAEQIELEFVRQDLCRERFARAARSGEKRAQSQAATRFFRKTPFVTDPRAMLHLQRNCLQSVYLRRGQHDVSPSRARDDMLSKVLQTRAGTQTTGLPKIGVRFFRLTTGPWKKS